MGAYLFPGCCNGSVGREVEWHPGCRSAANLCSVPTGVAPRRKMYCWQARTRPARTPCRRALAGDPRQQPPSHACCLTLGRRAQGRTWMLQAEKGIEKRKQRFAGCQKMQGRRHWTTRYEERAAWVRGLGITGLNKFRVSTVPLCQMLSLRLFFASSHLHVIWTLPLFGYSRHHFVYCLPVQNQTVAVHHGWTTDSSNVNWTPMVDATRARATAPPWTVLATSWHPRGPA